MTAHMIAIFSQREDESTVENYHFQRQLKWNYIPALTKQIWSTLEKIDNSLTGGCQIARLYHSLQAISRTERGRSLYPAKCRGRSDADSRNAWPYSHLLFFRKFRLG